MKFIESHNGDKKEISIYGQEYTSTTYKLAKMNLAIRGIAYILNEILEHQASQTTYERNDANLWRH